VASADTRYRLVYKPLVFAACLVPMLWVATALLVGIGLLHWQWGVLDLGVDPVRRMLGIVGKSALNLLLITLAVSPLRQLTGNAQLLRLRRMLGLFAFTYAVTHFLVYIGLFQNFDWSEIVKDIYKRWYIVLGFTALVLLIPLAITSTNAMMRRLKRRWQQLHYLIYPIAILGVTHFWMQKKKDIREALVYALILAVLLGFRVRNQLRRRRAAGVPPQRSGQPAAADLR
jgi:sulfoxide reductase heme-binding subunit YedZ